MEELFFIVGVGLIVYFIFNTRSRLAKLEQFMQSGGIQHLRPEQNYQPLSQQQAMSSEQFSQPMSIPLPPQIEPSSFDRFIDWLKEDWLLKLGAFILLIGFGWFVSYAFKWIGPMARITLGVLLGTCVLGFGWFRMHTYPRQGGVFLVLGSTIVLLTIFVGRATYKLFPSEIALAVMFLSVAFVALASVKFNRRPLALISVILAGVVPILTRSPGSDHVNLFTYLFVITLGAIWIVVITGQRSLTFAALIIVSFYSAADLLFPSALINKSTLLLFAYAFSAVFFITNTIGILKLKDKEIIPDLITAGGNGLFLLAWISIAADKEWQSLIVVGWMMIFVVTSFVVFAITKRREPFFVYMGAGIVMLATATGMQLNGAELTIAYIVEATIIPFVAYAVMRDLKIAETLTLLMIVPGFLSLESVAARDWRYSDVNPMIPFEHFFVILLMFATLSLLGIFFYALRQEERETLVAESLFIIGSIYAYILLWLSLHALLIDDTATMFSLIIYTIIGLIAYAYGKIRESKGVGLYGGTLLGFVVVHLLFVDVWDMELTGKVITFFAIGTLLTMTAFIGRKPKTINN